MDLYPGTVLVTALICLSVVSSTLTVGCGSVRYDAFHTYIHISASGLRLDLIFGAAIRLDVVSCGVPLN
jgi:hypothetical protein